MFNSKGTFGKVIFITLALLLSSCRYSPWETNFDCQKDLIVENLNRLASLEKQMNGEDYFKVAMVGDPQRRPLGMQKAVEKIARREDITFLLIPGDLSDTGLGIEFEWICKTLEKLDIPYFPVIGNHDTLSMGKEIWEEYFGAYDYAFTFLGTKFIIYNDNAYEFSAVPNFEWLAREAALQNGEVRYHTIGVSHVPPIADVHNEDEIFAMLQFFFLNGFDYTVHGHLARFVYWHDEFGTNHYVVADTDGVQYGVMTVYQDRVEFENCAPLCEKVRAK